MKKPISLILIISLIIPNLFFVYPQKTQATGIPVVDISHIGATTFKTVWDKVEKYTDKIAEAAGKLLARAILQVITQDTINWINSGFKGSPAFMTNPEGMLANAADRAVGQFILEDPDLQFLCEPFQLQVKLNLGMQYSYGTNIGCTLTGVLGNIEGAYDDFMGGDFIGGGGWDSWMQMASNPQNTTQGASMMAEGLLEVKLATVKETTVTEANWGSGALSLKDCNETTYEVTQNYAGAGGTTKTKVGKSKRTIGTNPGYSVGVTTKDVGPTIANTKATKAQTNQTNTSPAFYDTSGLGTAGYSLSGNDNYPSFNAGSPNNNGTTKQQVETSCKTTTPGAIISEGLKVSTWSWVGDSQLAAEVGNSINAILGAFATQLVKMTLTKLKGGLLGEGKNSNVDYMAQLDQQMSDAQTRLDQQQQSIDEQAQSGANTQTYGSGSAVDTGSPLITRRNNAKSQVDNLISINTTYQTTYTAVKTIYNNAKAELASTTECFRSKSGGQGSIDWITQNILDKINSTNSTASTTPVSLSQIESKLSIVNTNISSLQAMLPIINSTSTEEGIDEAMIPYNAIKISTDAIVPEPALKTSTTNWLNGEVSHISPSCPVNKTVWAI